MNLYETVLVFRRDLSPVQVEDLTKKYSSLLVVSGGKLHKTENWGLLNLAYPIKKMKKAYYVLLITSSSREDLQETNRQLGLDESILRSMTVTIDSVDNSASPMMKAKTKREGGENA
ncbi:MAG: 30S ribosomal protein S6 [Alphaproteobacteria bacterium]|nr:30S ribosomal protein S6 [Alphaproteobacteria bacterium]